MKRLHIMVIAAVVFAALAFPGAAYANHLKGSTDWKVTFNSDEKMDETYPENGWADDIGKLQPGDDITFTVNLVHANDKACDWYMANDVIKSLEESHASGSAYGYKLTYTNPGGTTRTLYDSTEVGGDDTKGLLDATSALKDFFYLDNFKKNDTAKVNLLVTLDGETEGNAYFDTLAQLKMKFAVELPTKGNSSNTNTTTTRGSDRSSVQTGDDTNLFPFYMAMVISGAALLALGIYSVRSRKREREQE